MSTPLNTSSSVWQDLQQHRQSWEGVTLRQLFHDDPQRAQHFSAEACGLYLDYSKHLINRETLRLLMALARMRRLLLRARPTRSEVDILRGIAAAMERPKAERVGSKRNR